MSNPSMTAPHPRSTTILIPLILSVVLITAGIALAIYLFIGYRKRNRAWLIAYRAHRQRIREEEKLEDGTGPGMWEIVIEEEDDEKCMMHEWNGKPIAVTYHHDDNLPAACVSPTPCSPSSITPTSISKDKEDKDRTPNHVEMTFLIAMPSPIQFQTRSRRSTPTSSLSIPSLSSMTTGIEGESSSVTSLGNLDEVPEVELATCVIPITPRL